LGKISTRRSVYVSAVLAASGLLLGGCGRTAGNEANAAAVNPAAASHVAEMTANAPVTAAPSNQIASALPSGFPGRDADGNGADCYAYLSFAMQAPGASTGFDNVAMGQARDQWRADLRQRLSEQETNQLTGSNVNPRSDTPAAQRDAAAHWCVEHAPEVDPR
jgi:hypothetical protein